VIKTTLKDFYKYVEQIYGRKFNSPKIHYDRNDYPETRFDGIHLSDIAKDTKSNPIMWIQELAHEIWHWLYEDYKMPMENYPKDVNGKYRFGMNKDFDYIEGRACFQAEKIFFEGRACFQAEKIFFRTKIESNLSGEYKKSFIYYKEELEKQKAS
jgi:hypothetical protein